MTDASDTAWAITLQHLKRRRDELGMSDYRLAIDAGVSFSHISRIFSGQTIPSVSAFYAICAALRLNVHLLHRDDDPLPYPDIPAPADN